MSELLYENGHIRICLEAQHSITHEKLFFFHTNEFINRNSAPRLFFNYWYRKECLMSMAFDIGEKNAISLSRSPFGGFILRRDPLRQQMDEFLKVIIDYFRKRQCSICIHQSPESYAGNFEKIHDCLTAHQLNISTIDISQHIEVDKVRFYEKCNRNRKRKIEACKRFTFLKLKNSHLEEAHGLITECRMDKGYPVTMTLSELSRAFTAFPKRYLLFGVLDGNKLIATGISIVVNNEVLYNFYHGDRLAYREYSPVSILVSGIYEYCQKQKFNMLDLGVSSECGVVNQGLHNFKRSCGTTDTRKITYELAYEE